MNRWKVAFLSLLTASSVASANAQIGLVPRGGMTGAALGSSIGRSMGQVMSGMREGRIIAAQFERDLTQARADFANSAPGSAAEADAAVRLDRLRQTVDLYQFTQDMTRVFADDTEERMEALNEITFGQKAFGGGLSPGTEDAFNVWRDAMLEHMSGGDGVLGFGDVSSKKMLAAFEATAPQYVNYLEVRDWYEFTRAGKAPNYFSSADDYLRFMIRWFPNSRGTGAGASDERVEAIREQLFEAFGEKRVLAAADKLRRQPQEFAMRLKDPAAIGLLAYRSQAPGSLAGLLERDVDLEAYGLILMGGAVSLESLDNARLRLDAWHEQHGRSKVDGRLKAMRGAPLGEDGLLIDEPHAGKTVIWALLTELPLDPDPVSVKREQEQRRRLAEIAADQAAQVARAKAKAGEYLDAFLEARAIADRMDAERRTWFTPEQLEDPRTKGRMYRDRLDSMTAAWNVFLTKGSQTAGEYAAMRGRMLGRDDPRMSPAMVRDRDALAAMLAFTQEHERVGPSSRFPMAGVQAERIASGEMAASDAVDWDFRLQFAERERMDAYNQKKREAFEAQQAEQARQRAEAEALARAEAEARRASTPDPTGRRATRERGETGATGASDEPGQAGRTSLPGEAERNDRASAGYQLDGFLAARELAREADAAWLVEINAEREAAGLEPWTEWDFTPRLIEVVAGFWDEHRADPRSAAARYAKPVMSSLKRRSPELHRRLEEPLEFMFARDRRSMALQGTMADEQRGRLADGSMDSESALPFVASRDLHKAIEALMQARLELHEREMALVEYRQEGARDSTIRRAEGRVTNQVEEVEEAMADVEAARAEAQAESQ